MTYAQAIKESLEKIKTEERQYKYEDGTVETLKEREMYPITFPTFVMSIAGIIAHMEKTIHGGKLSVEELIDDLLRADDVSLQALFASAQITMFVNWLLDKEANTDTEDNGNGHYWDEPYAIIDLFNEFATGRQKEGVFNE